MKYLSVKEMIAVEKAADAAGHSYAAMMEAAGKGLAEVIQSEFGQIEDKRITGLVGSGNNGGDALVALDYLLSRGWQTSALLFRERDLQDPLIKRVLKNGGDILACFDYPQSQVLIRREISKARVLVDGVLGTGMTLPIREPLNLLLNYVKTELAWLPQECFLVG